MVDRSSCQFRGTSIVNVEENGRTIHMLWRRYSLFQRHVAPLSFFSFSPFHWGRGWKGWVGVHIRVLNSEDTGSKHNMGHRG